MRDPLRIRAPRVSARARTVLAIAAVFALGAGATGAAGVTLNEIPDPPAPPLGWAVNGAAQPVPAGFQLTRAGHHDEAGSAFWTTAVDLGAPTGIAFDATMSGGTEAGADGMTLVFADALHGGNPHVAGESASALGYGGIPGIAVALDTYQNTGEPSGNFVGIADGLDDNGSPNYLSTATNVPDLRAAPHHFEVDVTHDHIDLSMDGRTVLSRDVALPTYAFVGFTASNGGYTDDHVVSDIRATAASGIGSIGSSTGPIDTPTSTPPPTTPACVGVAMNSGQPDIDAAPPGTTFCLSGTHDWTLTPKSGDTITGGILDGQNTAQYAFVGTATNVTLNGIEVRNYRAASQQAAIEATGSGWTLRDLQVHDNGTVGNGEKWNGSSPPSGGGSGSNLGSGWQILGGRYYNNRQNGLAGGGTGSTVDGVEVDHNNFTDASYTERNIDCDFEAGGIKWVSANLTIENSKVHDNACRGIWADINASGAKILNNHVYNNWADGIMIEISTTATISGNTVSGNGFKEWATSTSTSPCQGQYGAGIFLSTSSHTDVDNNALSDNCRNITLAEEARGAQYPTLEYDSVHDNVVTGGGFSGAAEADGTDLSTRHLTFTNNTFAGGATFCQTAC